MKRTDKPQDHTERPHGESAPALSWKRASLLPNKVFRTLIVTGLVLTVAEKIQKLEAIIDKASKLKT
jgi:hypothetical protein